MLLIRDSVLNPSVEDINSEIELEYVWYVRVPNVMDMYTNLTSKGYQNIHQVQAEKKYHTLRTRIRREESNSEVKYTYTIKTTVNVEQGANEINVDIDQSDYSAMIKEMPMGWDKNRLLIPTSNDLIFEIDFFKNRDGLLSSWIKIDLEVKQPLEILPPLPIIGSEVIKRDYTDPTQIEKIKPIFDEWLIDVTKQ